MAGLELSKSTSGGEWCGRVSTYDVASSHATAIALGDAAILTGTSNTDGVAGIDAVSGVIATKVTGVIVGVTPDYSEENLNVVGLPASTGRLVQVIDDPNALFECESDATLSAGDVGSNVGINGLNRVLLLSN